MHASGWGINDSDLECWIVGLACILIFLCPRMQSKWRTRLRTKLYVPRLCQSAQSRKNILHVLQTYCVAGIWMNTLVRLRVLFCDVMAGHDDELMVRGTSTAGAGQ